MYDVGEIALHDRHAIGLFPQIGKIRLHRYGFEGWMIGIRLSLDLRHYRKAGSTSGFMTLDSLEMTIPGEKGPYVGRIEGWDKYKTSGYTDCFKPLKCTLSPLPGEYITFSPLNAHAEKDPYFYFGWGLRSDHMPPYGYRRRSTVVYMGVNYPVEDGLAPDWTDVPPQQELLNMLRPLIPQGQWNVKAQISGFVVDAGVAQTTHIAARVWEGWRRFFRGGLDFVLTNQRIVGKMGVDWSGINWGKSLDPGDLAITSGKAGGAHFRVVGTQFTGWNPPPGCPANTWLIFTHPDDPVPGMMGVSAGDDFQLSGPYDFQVFKLAESVQYFDPGTCPPHNLELAFSPKS